MSETTEKVKHTPGPWEVRAAEFVGGAVAYEIVMPRIEINWANKTLIETAPDLLEACKALFNLTDQACGYILSRSDGKPITNGDQAIIDAAYILAETAISKAEGRE